MLGGTNVAELSGNSQEGESLDGSLCQQKKGSIWKDIFLTCAITLHHGD
jgi:hypothetical protein